jgi:hypothetical protein
MADDSSAQTFKELAKGATDVVFNSSFPILSRLFQSTSDRETEATRAVRGLEDSQQKFDNNLLKVNSQLSTLSTYSFRSLGLLGDILKEFKTKNGTLVAAAGLGAAAIIGNNMLSGKSGSQVPADPAIPAPGPTPQNEKNSNAPQASGKSPATQETPAQATPAGPPPPVTAPTETNKPRGTGGSNTGGATKNTQVQNTGGDPTVERILNTIKIRESNSNYTVKNPRSSASGAYQFIDSTWASLTKKYDMGTEFKHASQAPAAIQDEVARRYVKEILQSNGNDVTKVPLVWYTGNPQGRMAAGASEVNRGLAPATYQANWMKTYNSLGPPDDSTKKKDAIKTSGAPKPGSPGAQPQVPGSGEEQGTPAPEKNATPEKTEGATPALNPQTSTGTEDNQGAAQKTQTPQATPAPSSGTPGPSASLEPSKMPESKPIETGEKLQRTSANLESPVPQQQGEGSQVVAMNQQQQGGQGIGNRAGAPEKLRDPTKPGNVEPEDSKSRYKDLFGIG